MTEYKKYHILYNGLGAGNIGEDAIYNGFLSLFPLPEGSSFEVWDADSPILKQYGNRYEFIDYIDTAKCCKKCFAADCVLLIGGTPVMDRWGIDLSIKDIAERLEFCHNKGIKTYSLGCGIDMLKSLQAKEAFDSAFVNIDGWTVRGYRSKKNLISMGVPAHKITTAADFTWNINIEDLDYESARVFLIDCGLSLEKRAIAVNVVNEVWMKDSQMKEHLAGVFDTLIDEHNYDIVFFCNETRFGEYFDYEATRSITQYMRNSPVIIPNKYFTAHQIIAMLSFCHISISWRYHFSIFSALASIPCISVLRAEKMMEFAEETAGFYIDIPEKIDVCKIVENIVRIEDKIGKFKEVPRLITQIMRIRSKLNLINISDRLLKSSPVKDVDALCALSSVGELKSNRFRSFMYIINSFAQKQGLTVYKDDSKEWELPWLWYNYLSSLEFCNTEALDMDIELLKTAKNPMPWFIASLGAKVHTIHSYEQFIDDERYRIEDELGISITKHSVKQNDKILPFDDNMFDLVTSFSVIEQETHLNAVISEIARVLKPGGVLCISFDLAKQTIGATCYEYERALTINEFVKLLWQNPAFNTPPTRPMRNVEDISQFLQWNIERTECANCTAGAVVLQKRR
ncbi:Polysaccharide pyruvyl transferase [Candidatus Magnetoovum chiemensis]|nr:Polysaccharide pyruvyl transferase [Candidatus Magnetoovum chiemensis]